MSIDARPAATEPVTHRLLPPGHTARPPRLEAGDLAAADARAVVERVRRYDTHHLGRCTSPPEQVLAGILAEGAQAAVENVLLVESAGDAVAFMAFEAQHADPAAAQLWFDVYVDPACTAGLEGPLVAAGLDRARAWLAGTGADGAEVRSGAARSDARTAAALAAAGLTHERTFFGMERALQDGDEIVPPAPPGVRVRLVPDDQAGRALVHAVSNQGFRDHWAYVDRDHDDWWRNFLAGREHDPTQWWVAELDGEPVGLCLGDASRGALGSGYVPALTVLPAARGRGVARHLLRVAFAEHRRRGWATSQLSVDSANPTGALQLYQSVGMSPVEVIDIYGARLTR